MYILMVSFLDIFLVRHTMYTLYWLRHNVPFARSSFSILSVSCYRLLVVPRCTSIIKSQLKLAVSTDQHQRFGTTVINVATIPTIIKQRSLIILSHSWSVFKLSKCKAFFSRVFFLSTYGYSIFLTGNFVVVHLCKQQQHTANRWEVNHKQYREIKVHIPCQVPNVVVQSKENHGVGYPEWENS